MCEINIAQCAKKTRKRNTRASKTGKVHLLPWKSDIILKGFLAAEKQHGVRYINFVGDGDSSVYPTLVSNVPGWGYSIKKQECANHALKCYRASLEQLIKDKPSYKGKHKLTETMRQKLTKAARCAVIMRSKESNKHKAAALLQEDILNGPLHCFGSHHKRKADYCKVVRSLEKENTNGNASQSVVTCFDILDQSTDETNSSTCSVNSNASDDSGISLDDSSGNNPELNELSTDSDFACFENEEESIDSFLQEQEAAWNNATSSTTESGTAITAALHTDTTTVSLDPPHPIDHQMICDIRAIASRLASKAHQLLGLLAGMEYSV